MPYVFSDAQSLTNQSVAKVFRHIASRFQLRVSVWLLLMAKVVPRRFRNARTNKVIELAEEGLDRLDKALDV